MFSHPFLLPLPRIFYELFMYRLLYSILFCVAVICSFGACSGNNDGNDGGRSYLIKGSVTLDSTFVANNQLVLYTDNHRILQQDTLRLTSEGTFEFEGSTNSVDELYLCDERGELCRFYASGDMVVDLSLTMGEQGARVKYLSQSTDTINGWLQEQKTLFEGQSTSICHLLMDSLIRNHPNDLRVTLLLRDQMTLLEDSLYIRQSLGSLSDEAKPEWMKKSIDNTLKEMGSGRKVFSHRLLGAAFELSDTIIDLSTSRPDYMLVYFWADYSQPSVDSLRTLAKLLETDYDNKRVSFLSCCLHAQDSASWRLRSNFLPGNHTWVQGGFSDPRMRAWNIQEVPSIILMDMYCNQQQRDVWGAELRKALDRIPNRIGYQKKN